MEAKKFNVAEDLDLELQDLLKKTEALDFPALWEVHKQAVTAFCDSCEDFILAEDLSEKVNKLSLEAVMSSEMSEVAIAVADFLRCLDGLYLIVIRNMLDRNFSGMSVVGKHTNLDNFKVAFGFVDSNFRDVDTLTSQLKKTYDKVLRETENVGINTKDLGLPKLIQN